MSKAYTGLWSSTKTFAAFRSPRPRPETFTCTRLWPLCQSSQRASVISPREGSARTMRARAFLSSFQRFCVDLPSTLSSKTFLSFSFGLLAFFSNFIPSLSRAARMLSRTTELLGNSLSRSLSLSLSCTPRALPFVVAFLRSLSPVTSQSSHLPFRLCAREERADDRDTAAHAQTPPRNPVRDDVGFDEILSLFCFVWSFFGRFLKPQRRRRENDADDSFSFSLSLSLSTFSKALLRALYCLVVSKSAILLSKGEWSICYPKHQSIKP